MFFLCLKCCWEWLSGWFYKHFFLIGIIFWLLLTFELANFLQIGWVWYLKVNVGFYVLFSILKIPSKILFESSRLRGNLKNGFMKTKLSRKTLNNGKYNKNHWKLSQKLDLLENKFSKSKLCTINKTLLTNSLKLWRLNVWLTQGHQNFKFRSNQ
jgi:hypothetical protein